MLLQRSVLKTAFCFTVSTLLLIGNIALGATQVPTQSIEQPPESSQALVKPSEEVSKLKSTFGMTYFTVFYGPGIHPDNFLISPNQLGNAGNDGIYFQNQVSVRYKFSSNLALDFQSRFNVFLNNGVGNEKFSTFRWETPRIGVSGRLASGNDWSLTGAINTDFPYFFPVPFSGYQAQQRKVIFTPGMFAGFKYEPKGSRWSVFSTVSPRYLIYADRNAGESQMANSGFIPQNKPEFILAFSPTINYRIDTKLSLTLGTSIDYRKQVVSSWNPFNASLISNGEDPAWRLFAVPVTLGVTYNFSPSFTIFPFLCTYPIAVQRIDAQTPDRRQATLLEATSFGMWISGTLF